MRFMYRSISSISSKLHQNQLRIMVARGFWFLRDLERLTGLVTFFYTLLAFVLAASLLPFLFVTYFVMKAVRSAWFHMLQCCYPELEFVWDTTIRTAIDTPRNQGLITVLLQVKGCCDMDHLRAHIQEHFVERRKADGSLAYPHLRTALTSRYGRYAWQKLHDFSLDKHLIAVRPVYRGRPVREHNIREYVSDTVFQLLPSDLPPWQVTVIPTLSRPEEKFFILVRLHHLLAEEGLSLADLLLLSSQQTMLAEDDENPLLETIYNRPAIGYFKTPIAIPKLYNTIRETTANFWNQFILNYDPLENKDIVKSPPYITTCMAVFTIIVAAVIGDIYRSLVNTDHSYMKTLSNVHVIAQRQFKRRQFNLSFLLHGAFRSLCLVHFVKNAITWTWWLGVTCFMRMPLLLLREFLLLSTNGSIVHGSMAEVIYRWYLLVYDSFKEVWYVWKVIFTGPRIVMEELLRSQRCQVHQLQTVSLSGRKVVSWSDPVPMTFIQKICAATGSTSGEVLMSSTARVLRDYFRQLGLSVPDEVLTTGRFMPLEKLMNCSKENSDGIAWLCLALPTRNALGADDDPLAGLRQLETTVVQARACHTLLHFVSLWGHTESLITTLLPSIVVRLIVNYLSRSYSVTLTDIAPEHSGARKKLLWGQEVESLIYWRTPQANISLSLSLMNYGNTVRLGVMSDAQLSPQHRMITADFVQQLHELAVAAGVPRDRATPPSSSLRKFR